MKRFLKSKGILIVIIILVVILLLAFLFGREKPVQIGELQSFRYDYNQGYMANSNVWYTLELKDGVYTAGVKPHNVPPEDEKSFTVTEDFARDLEQILVDHEVGAWNGFDKVDKRVLDGNGFSLYITMTDGTSVDAHGYMRWPKNYTDVKAAVEALFHAHMPQ